MSSILKLLSRFVGPSTMILIIYLIVIGLYTYKYYHYFLNINRLGPCIYQGQFKFNKKILYSLLMVAASIFMISDHMIDGFKSVILIILSIILFVLMLYNALDRTKIYSNILYLDSEFHFFQHVLEYQFIENTKEDDYLLKLKIKFDPKNIPYEETRTLKVDYEHYHKLQDLFKSKQIKEA